jgi:DNA-binding NarL/FixJ family response regulator
VTTGNAAVRSLRVAIVEDGEDLREGLRALIDRAPGFACTGTWGAMEPALQGLQSSPPHVVLVDIGLPGMSGIEGIALLKERRVETVPVVLTVYQDDDRIFQALCAGARGYLLKKTPSPRLLAALEEAAAGGAPMSPEIARQVVDLFTRFRPAPQADHGLTPHELRVLGLLVEGYDLSTVARRLGVTRATIAFHVRKIYEKLEVHSKSEAVAKALRSGLVK